MIAFARLSFLAAGALLALVPLALHLLARRPPERRALPTTRFLRPLPRTALRLERRPSDVLLLLLRSLFLVLLGAAFAGAAWRPHRTGTLDVVLLDRGLAMAERWAEGVDSVRAALGAGGELVLFDTAAVRIGGAAPTAVLFDSLASTGAGGAPGDYAVAFHALGTVARARPEADSLRVTLITRPRWEGWSAGFGEVRRAMWPGGVRLVEVEGDRELSPTPGGEDDSGGWQVRVLGEGGRYVQAALTASNGRGEVDVVLAPRGEDDGVLERARGGAVVVVAGEVPAGVLGDALPWVPGMAGRAVAGGAGGAGTAERTAAGGAAPGALVLPSGEALHGVAERWPGTVRAGAHLLAVWEDGRPAAAAVREGAGCLVYLATALEGGRLPLDPAFPALVEHLVRGCEPVVSSSAHGDRPHESPNVRPLDTGARAILRGEGAWTLPTTALVGEGATAGRPLGRWLLLAALATALVETALVYRRRAA